MVVVVAAVQAEKALSLLKEAGEEACLIGQIESKGADDEIVEINR
jgi:phosphoribosylaminoimidazole (AIR) synthetase